MYGWVGTILSVDLTSGRIEKVPLSKELASNYVGGRGINVRILYDQVKPGIDPLGPENMLIIGSGPLSGTMLPAGKTNITGVSPMTHIIGDATGGFHFSPEQKFAGYDHIVFSGKAEKPVYLWIDDDKTELRDAKHLWGKTIDVAMSMIRKELGDRRIQIACIGPAGENLVRLANVMVGDGSCSRTGVGAIMGSKNLKAVAVRGTKGVKVAQPDVFMKLAKDLEQRQFKSPNFPGLSIYGTTRILNFWQRHNTVAIRNTQQTGSWAGFNELSHESFQKRFFTKDYACFACPISCHTRWEIKDGPYAGEKGPFVELGPIAAWGPILDNAYAPSVLKAYNMCNHYGIDVMNCGEVIAAATEWYQRGLITKEDTEGIELEWGDYEAFLKMIPKIANREGIGELLAEGGVRAARELGRGADKCLTYCKGAMWTSSDDRYSKTWQLGIAVATRGADHLRGATQGAIRDYAGTETVENQLYAEGQAKSVYDIQCLTTLADALEICKFSTTRVGMAMSLKDMADLFSAATGIRVDEDSIREMADRIWTLERAFLVREGVTREDDTLAGRWKEEPPRGGPLDGIPHNQEKWDKLLDEYYDLVGWDKRTGAPTRTKLESLGLKDIADELERDAAAIKQRRASLPWVGYTESDES